MYKVETATGIKWFRTFRGASRYASKHPSWKVEIPKDYETEWAKKCLGLPNNYKI